MYWVIYFDASHPDPYLRGEIKQIYHGPEVNALQCVGSNQSILEAEADPHNDYIDLATLSIAQKQTLNLVLSKDTIAADDLDEAVISGLPIPYTVYVNEQAVVVDDGTLEIASDTPGVHRVTVGGAMYHQERFVIYAA